MKKLNNFILATAIATMVFSANGAGVVKAADPVPVLQEEELDSRQASTYCITYHYSTYHSVETRTIWVTNDMSINLEEYFNQTVGNIDGYWLEGFYDNPEFKGDPIEEITTGSVSNYTIYVKLRPIDTTFSLKIDADTKLYNGYPYFSFTTETPTFNLPVAEKSGYTFVGWHFNKNLRDEAFTKIEQGTYYVDYSALYYLYPEFTPDTYQLNYMIDDDTILKGDAPKTYNIETPTFDLPVPEKAGYTFIGWHKKEDLSDDVITRIEKGTKYNQNLYPEFTATVYQISLQLEPGIKLDGDFDIKYTVETPMFELPEAQKEGYVFVGWHKEQDLHDAAIVRIRKGTIGNFILYPEFEAVSDEGDDNVQDTEPDSTSNDQQDDTDHSNRDIPAQEDPIHQGTTEDVSGEPSTNPSDGKTITDSSDETDTNPSNGTTITDSSDETVANPSNGKTVTDSLDGMTTNPSDKITEDSSGGSVTRPSDGKTTETDRQTASTEQKAAASNKITVSRAAIKKVSNKKGKKLYVAFKKVSGAQGYELQYSTSKKFSKKAAKTVTIRKGKTTYTSKKLTRKRYYVRVRAYKLDSTGNKVYGKWSPKKSVVLTK